MMNSQVFATNFYVVNEPLISIRKVSVHNIGLENLNNIETPEGISG